MYRQTFSAFLAILRYIFSTIIAIVSQMYNYQCISEKFKNMRLGFAEEPYDFKPYRVHRVKEFMPFCYMPITPYKYPMARSGHSMVADSAYFYCIGGYNPHHTGEMVEEDGREVELPDAMFREMWRFNFSSRRWTRFRNRGKLPMELASNSAIMHHNRMLVYGGTGHPFGRKISNDLYICNIEGKKGLLEEMEKAKVTGKLPKPSYGSALVLHDDCLYTIGGTCGTTFNCDIHRLNLLTNLWEEVYLCRGHSRHEPTGRYKHTAACDGRYIYILGGGTPRNAHGFQEIPVFDMEKLTWNTYSTLPDSLHGYPKPRRFHGGDQLEVDGSWKVYICCGQGMDRAYNDLWSLDLTTAQWCLHTTFSLSHNLFFHGTAVAPQGKMYLFGGNVTVGTSDDSTRGKDLYSTWLCIPKLSEICWEAVLHYWPEINAANRDHLIRLGFPRGFVRRLDVL